MMMQAIQPAPSSASAWGRRRDDAYAEPAADVAMRFTCRPRCAYLVTDRKRAAAARWQKRQRDNVPLLAPLIASTQPSIDDVMDERVRTWIVTEQRERDRRAARWLAARRDISRRDPSVRRALLAYWNGHRWLPGNPSYLLDMLHSFDRGRLVLLNGQVVPDRIVIPVSEAVTAFENPKPVSGGWLGQSPGKPRAPGVELKTYQPTSSQNHSKDNGENHDYVRT